MRLINKTYLYCSASNSCFYLVLFDFNAYPVHFPGRLQRERFQSTGVRLSIVGVIKFFGDFLAPLLQRSPGYILAQKLIHSFWMGYEIVGGLNPSTFTPMVLTVTVRGVAAPPLAPAEADRCGGGYGPLCRPPVLVDDHGLERPRRRHQGGVAVLWPARVLCDQADHVTAERQERQHGQRHLERRLHRAAGGRSRRARPPSLQGHCAGPPPALLLRRRAIILLLRRTICA